MTRIFSDVGQLLTALIPPWALPFVLVAIGVALVPPWIESVRSKQIKGALRRMVRAEPEEQKRLADWALDLAGQKRTRLIGFVQEAIRYGHRDLVEEGLLRLEAHPRAHEDALKLRERVQGPRPRFRDPVEASVRIEGLLDQGLLVGAEEQLSLALGQFPDHPDLMAHRELLHALREQE